jgi:hypothetical protein
VLVACWCLDDEERRNDLRGELEEIRRAYLTNYASWDSKQLERARQQLLGRLATSPSDEAGMDEIIDAARAYIDAAIRTTTQG